MAKRRIPPEPPRRGMVRLDPAKLRHVVECRGEADNLPRGGPSKGSWEKAFDGDWILRSTAESIADALDCELRELLVPTTDGETDEFSWPEHPEWKMADHKRSGWQTSSNGLQYFRCEVTHAFLGSNETPVRGAATFFDLTSVADDERNRMERYLLRHAELCRQLSDIEYIIRNVSVAPVSRNDFWWVVDEWQDARRLTDVIAGTATASQLKRVFTQLVDGVQQLHERGVILRELSPSRLLVTQRNDVRFIDLALATLNDDSKTVSSEWPVDPFRAPEVDSKIFDKRADFYSVGMILLQASVGDATLTRSERNSLRGADVPKRVKECICDCLNPKSDERPESLDGLAAAIADWDVP